MLGDGGLGEPDLVDDIAADAGLLLVQHLQDADTGWVPDRLAEQSDLLILGRMGRYGFAQFDGGHSGFLHRYSTIYDE